MAKSIEFCSEELGREFRKLNRNKSISFIALRPLSVRIQAGEGLNNGSGNPWASMDF